MACHRINLGNSQLQVGARLRRLSLLLALALAISSTSAIAATKKPSPTPTSKVTAKATTKATAKATVKTSAKPSASATAKASAKPTATATTKPKPKPKPKPRKKVTVSPSPKPKWPPVGFEYEAGIYAKIPTSKELVGVISAKGNLASQVAACSKFICGAVQVAAEPGCLWWEVNSKVYGRNKEPIGALRTIAGQSLAREVKTILLISPEPLESLEYVSSIEVVCHQEAKPEGTESVTFTKVNN
jgi:cobalamin biosynthesis Mg chelatase CobN